jgi:hypothetical protein
LKFENCFSFFPSHQVIFILARPFWKIIKNQYTQIFFFPKIHFFKGDGNISPRLFNPRILKPIGKKIGFCMDLRPTGPGKLQEAS